MTNNMTVTYKSSGGTVLFSPESDFWLSEITGLENHVEMATSQSVGQYGCSVNSQSVQSKKITFTGDIHGDILSARKQLLATVVPGVLAQLSFYDDGKTYIIDGYPTKTPEIEFGNAMQTFQFEFFAPYPYFRSAQSFNYMLAGVNPLWQTPFTMQGEVWISRFVEDSFISVTNSGNVPQTFAIDIYATAEFTNPTIYNVTTGGVISINKTFTQGDRMRISTHETDKNNGVALIFTEENGISENAFRYISADSDLDMKIVPGVNIFMADAQTNKTNMQCAVAAAGGEYHSI